MPRRVLVFTLLVAWLTTAAVRDWWLDLTHTAHLGEQS